MFIRDGIIQEDLFSYTDSLNQHSYVTEECKSKEIISQPLERVPNYQLCPGLIPGSMGDVHPLGQSICKTWFPDFDRLLE